MAAKNGATDNAIDRLPPHHPLLLHPSETQGSTIVQHTLTGSENYLVWSRAMQIALRGKRKIGFIDGTCTKDSQEDLQEQWEQVNAVVLSWILNSISRELANSVIFHQDAHLVWSKLQECFDSVTGSCVFSIHREINNLRQGTSPVSVYYSKLKELWEEEGTLFPIPSYQCQASKAYSSSVQR